MLVCMGQNQPLEGTSDSKASMGPAGAFAVRAPQLSRSICPIICHLTPIGLDPKGGPNKLPACLPPSQSTWPKMWDPERKVEMPSGSLCRCRWAGVQTRSSRCSRRYGLVSHQQRVLMKLGARWTHTQEEEDPKLRKDLKPQSFHTLHSFEHSCAFSEGFFF